jgi:hypothetical protein
MSGGILGAVADAASFGIHVPKGHIEVLEAAADNLEHVGRTADRAGRELRHAAKVDGWEGSASAAFTATIVANAAPADIAEKELPRAARALRELADDLRAARRATQHAIEVATAAYKRQQEAEREATAAQAKAANASADATGLQGVIDSAATRGDHAPEIRQTQDDLKRSAAHAEAAAEDARREANRAAHQIDEAQRDGRAANTKYDHACRAAAKVLQSVAAAAPGMHKDDPAAITWDDVDRLLVQPAKKALPAAALILGLGKILTAKSYLQTAGQIASWARLPPARAAELLARLQPTLNNSPFLLKAATKLANVPGLGKGLGWLTDVARNPLLKKVGVAGGAISLAGDTVQLYHDFTEGGESTAAVANHIAGTAFDASATAFLVAPTPFTAGATVVTGAAYLGTEAWEHWDDVSEFLDNATDAAGEFIDDAGEVASDVAHTLSFGIL